MIIFTAFFFFTANTNCVLPFNGYVKYLIIQNYGITKCQYLWDNNLRNPVDDPCVFVGLNWRIWHSPQNPN